MTTTEALTTAAHTIHKAGGPKAPWIGDDAWCDLADDYVYGELVAEYDADKRHTENRAVRCPPAVEAAVVAFALKVMAWMNRKDEGHNITMWPDDESESWGVDIWIAGEAGPTFSTPNELAAAEALIVAVAGEVGDA